MTDLQKRMAELMEPINRQLMMCDDYQEQLMLASAMLVTVKDIYDLYLTPGGRKEMFRTYVD